MNFKDKELRKEFKMLSKYIGFEPSGDLYWFMRDESLVNKIYELHVKLNKLYAHLGLEICEGGEIKKVSKKP